MSDKEQNISTTGLIFKISAITGCQLPTHDAHVNALEQELLLFLKEFNGYDTYTNEEILTAFRMNAAFQLDEKVEDYGKVFNIEYIGKILHLYSKKRQKLEYKLKAELQEQEIKKTLHEASQKRRVKIKEQYQIFVSDNNGQLDLADCYMQLKEDGGFENGDYHRRYIGNEPALSYNSVSRAGDFFSKKIEAGFKAERQSVLDYFKALYDITKKDVIYANDWTLIMRNFHKEEDNEITEPQW